jgi:hypothetical protein
MKASSLARVRPFIVFPRTNIDSAAPMGVDILFSVGALQEIDPERHRTIETLILSDVEGWARGEQWSRATRPSTSLRISC